MQGQIKNLKILIRLLKDNGENQKEDEFLRMLQWLWVDNQKNQKGEKEKVHPDMVHSHKRIELPSRQGEFSHFPQAMLPGSQKHTRAGDCQKPGGPVSWQKNPH
ncbi:hypothetical protein GCM10007426_09810 [Alloalcanivorax dieselolei]|nr:hypothetical protein GCM10007426_09810 [Alloalcanivorax dieselolei]